MKNVRIESRFRLDQVTRAQAYYQEPDTETTQLVESAHVRLNAVQGKPFGAATPSGHIDMVIVNPLAAKVFFDAPIGQEFEVMLSPVPEPVEQE